MKLTHLAGMMLAATIALASPAAVLAGDIIFDIPVGPVVELSAPVEAIAAIPGGNSRDEYKQPFGAVTDELQSNQCWTNARKVNVTAGTQDANGVCIWNNGTLASMGGGGRPGIAAILGQYKQKWFGLEKPVWDFTDEHDLLHDHHCEGMSTPASC